ncbi:hypothetical protein VTK26DRAFT_2331 [Humicola hyalothermophila]
MVRILEHTRVPLPVTGAQTSARQIKDQADKINAFGSYSSAPYSIKPKPCSRHELHRNAERTHQRTHVQQQHGGGHIDVDIKAKTIHENHSGSGKPSIRNHAPNNH